MRHGKRQTASATLSELLATHAAEVTTNHVTLGDIDEQLGRKSICMWLLVLALPMAFPIQIPGISVLFGVPLMVISAQLLFGYRRAWLPPFLARRSLSRADYVGNDVNGGSSRCLTLLSRSAVYGVDLARGSPYCPGRSS